MFRDVSRAGLVVSLQTASDTGVQRINMFCGNTALAPLEGGNTVLALLEGGNTALTPAEGIFAAQRSTIKPPYHILQKKI